MPKLPTLGLGFRQAAFELGNLVFYFDVIAT